MQVRGFTPEQLRQAGKSGFISPRQRHLRPLVTSYPIDNKLPETHADRDDAFHVEKIVDGYLVHIHIADVAAYVPRDTPLDEGALDRAFTRYRPQVRDPMFPMELSEGRMSLEDGTERLALTTTVRLDKHCRPVGVEFSRTLIASQAHDYDMASERMRKSGDPFELMAKVARGILNPRTMMAIYDEKTGLKVDMEGMVSFVDPVHLPVTRMVETYMVLANRMVAEFAAKCGLPFLFRNHGGTLRGEDQNQLVHNIRDLLSDDEHLTDKDRRKEMRRIMAKLDLRRATYAPEMKGHIALNLSEGYAHFTSPIRRYADLVNQRMIHYVVEQLDKAEQHFLKLAENLGMDCDAPRLHAALWQNAAALFHVLIEAKHSGKRKFPGKLHALERILEMVAEEAMPVHMVSAESMQTSVSSLANMLLKPALPYTKKELKVIATHINKAASSERKALRQITVDKAANWIEKIFPDTDATKLSAFTPRYFSALLHRTAQAGLMNEIFHYEVMRRFDDHKLDIPYDLYSILIEGKEHQSDFWRSLKKRALREIEKDGMSQISHIFSTAQNNRTIPAGTDIIEGMFQHSSTGETLHAARVVTDVDGRSYSAPHYSLSYSDKGARKRAIYDFIACLTFNDLVPMEEAVLPSKHYAELDSLKSGLVLEKIARETGLQLESSKHIAKGHVYFTYTVHGGSLTESISVCRHAPTLEEAQRKAARGILRHTDFKRAAAEFQPITIEFGRMPEATLLELVRTKGWPVPDIEVRDYPDSRTGQRRFQALLMLMVPEYPFIASGDSPIKQLAIRQACREALTILKGTGQVREEELQQTRKPNS